MQALGVVRKMSIEPDDGLKYFLNLNREKGPLLNECFGRQLRIHWTGSIFCIKCGKRIKKSFGQGFCYDHFRSAPEAAPCIVKPELCEAHLGKGRDVEWEEAHHNKPHFVYLAQTSSIKVGVTRDTQIPTRWLDQGAQRAVNIAKVPYRRLAGELEVELKQYFSDKTDWRLMLTNVQDSEDLNEWREAAISFFSSRFQEFSLPDEPIHEFSYPVEEYPGKVNTINLEKDPSFEGKLTGIRGQYLYFNKDRVINLRKYTGYEVGFSC